LQYFPSAKCKLQPNHAQYKLLMPMKIGALYCDSRSMILSKSCSLWSLAHLLGILFEFSYFLLWLSIYPIIYLIYLIIYIIIYILYTLVYIRPVKQHAFSLFTCGISICSRNVTMSKSTLNSEHKQLHVILCIIAVKSISAQTSQLSWLHFDAHQDKVPYDKL